MPRYLISSSTEKSLSVALLGVVAFVLVSSAQMFIHIRNGHYNGEATVILQSALLTAIYDKSIRLSSTSRGRYSTGQVLNLLSVDVSRLRQLWYHFMCAIFDPIMVIVHSIETRPQLVASFTAMYFVLGWSAFAGVIVLVLYLPVNIFLGSFSSTYQACSCSAHFFRSGK